MNDITAEIGLLKRQVRDVQSVTGNVQHLLRRLIEGGSTPRRDGSLVVRLAASQLIARAERRPAAAVAQ